MEDTSAVLLAHGPTTPPAAAVPAASRADVFLPWLLSFGMTLPLALLVDDAERWLALGAALGLAAGAAIAWHMYRRARRLAAAAIARAQDDFRADADGRVAMVVRQFQWAVNDVTTLQSDLGAAKALALQAEQRARRAEQQVRALERELFRVKGLTLPRAGKPALAGKGPGAHPDENVFVTRDGELVSA